MKYGGLLRSLTCVAATVHTSGADAVSRIQMKPGSYHFFLFPWSLRAYSTAMRSEALTERPLLFSSLEQQVA
jgi:hypothetical protein